MQLAFVLGAYACEDAVMKLQLVAWTELHVIYMICSLHAQTST